MDLSKLKVAEIKEELDKRHVKYSGLLKAGLLELLEKTLKEEQENKDKNSNKQNIESVASDTNAMDVKTEVNTDVGKEDKEMKQETDSNNNTQDKEMKDIEKKETRSKQEMEERERLEKKRKEMDREDREQKRLGEDVDYNDDDDDEEEEQQQHKDKKNKDNSDRDDEKETMEPVSKKIMSNDHKERKYNSNNDSDMDSDNNNRRRNRRGSKSDRESSDRDKSSQSSSRTTESNPSSSSPSSQSTNTPPLRPTSKVLFIDKFVRPFRLDMVKDMLSQTGKVVDLWMNDIKSICFVSYESEEDAIKTRDTVNGLLWPPLNRSKLMAEYSTEEEFEKVKKGTMTVQQVQQQISNLSKRSKGRSDKQEKLEQKLHLEKEKQEKQLQEKLKQQQADKEKNKEKEREREKEREKNKEREREKEKERQKKRNPEILKTKTQPTITYQYISQDLIDQRSGSKLSTKHEIDLPFSYDERASRHNTEPIMIKNIVLLSTLLILAFITISQAAPSCSYDGVDYSQFRRASDDEYVATASNTKNKYFFNICGSVDECNGKVQIQPTSVCQLQSSGSYYTFGQPANISFTALPDGSRGAQLTYKSGSTCSGGFGSTRQTIILLYCKDDTSVQQVTESTCKATITMNVNCDGTPKKKGIGGGWIFVIILLSATTAYILFGVIFNWKVKSKHGAELFPNIGFWRDFGGLITDGVLFIRGKISGTEYKGYSRVA